MRSIEIENLDANAFDTFGNVIDFRLSSPRVINQGMCLRFSDLAELGHDPSGRLGVSLFKARLHQLPYVFKMVERHPLGPQTFLPLDGEPFLVIVDEDMGGQPRGHPRAFLTDRYQGINFRRGTWHGVLTPLYGSGLFAVIDWIGVASNVDEFWWPEPWIVGQDSI